MVKRKAVLDCKPSTSTIVLRPRPKRTKLDDKIEQGEAVRVSVQQDVPINMPTTRTVVPMAFEEQIGCDVVFDSRLLWLPAEVQAEIVSFLDSLSLMSLRSTSKTLLFLVDQHFFRFVIRPPFRTAFGKTELDAITSKTHRLWASKMISGFDFDSCSNLKRGFLKFLPKNLSFLNVGFCSNISDGTLKHIPDGITHLDISNTSITTEGLVNKLLRRANRLQTLNINNCHGIGCDILELLPQNLRHLNIKHLEMTSEHFLRLPKRLSSLSVCKVNAETIQHLPQYLERLEIILLQLGESTLKKLPTTLTHLNIANQQGITPEKLKELHPSIRHLDLTFQFRTASLQYIPTTVRSLSLRKTTLEEDTLKFLSPSLQRLDLYHVQGLEGRHLASLPTTIEHLVVENCPQLNTMEFLPCNLKKLCLLGNGFQFDAKQIPASVTHLGFYWKQHFSILRDLPQTVQLLEIPATSNLEELQFLPKHLHVRMRRTSQMLLWK
eukprot:TRINITY_DN4437_c0_g2_i1.p1 TRINITY_DN4437_c0_g2~~TRINITY_DN4437_c0_g2_i1.p1  ORF type:complete len:494 (-),score=134.49 TRINITY_DN4437_c0_g2_i1:134-1615(-)